MKVDEILHKLADYINSQRNSVEATAEPSGHSELAQQPDDIMIPPLQQKIELLKKAVGVENVYDEDQEQRAQEQAEAAKPTAEEEDSLMRMKRAAGIPVAVISELSDDEPLED
jgi:hypothetical protein